MEMGVLYPYIREKDLIYWYPEKFELGKILYSPDLTKNQKIASIALLLDTPNRPEQDYRILFTATPHTSVVRFFVRDRLHTFLEFVDGLEPLEIMRLRYLAVSDIIFCLNRQTLKEIDFYTMWRECVIKHPTEEFLNWFLSKMSPQFKENLLKLALKISPSPDPALLNWIQSVKN